MLFRDIDFSDLHRYTIPESDHAATAASDKIVACRIEHVEVVLDGRQRHNATHCQARHIDEESEVAYVRDQSGIGQGLSGCDLRVEECEQLHILAVALGI